MIIDSEKYNGMCFCNREHKMETEFCIIENGCLKNIDKYINECGLKGISVAVYDENTYKATSDRHPKVDFEVVLPQENLHANEHGVDLLLERLPQKVDFLIAVGAGTVHDITRYCAYKKKIDFVSCPTAASVDGFCSSVAAMMWNGCKKTLTAVAPKIVVADTEIIKNAPIRLAKSGFGDMVGKYIALTDWKIGNILLNEFYCQKIAGMTMDATKEVMNSIDGIINGKEDAYEKLTYGLLLSGLAMQMIGNSRPASGAEHHISHLIEMAPKGLKIDFDALHGEKVGVGTLIVMKKYQSLINKTDCNFTDYISPSDEAILKVFEKERFDDIKNENLNDAAQNVTSEVLKAKWQEVFSLLSTLPDAYGLKELYVRAGVKSELKDIGVSNDYEEFLLENAPMVRNRLTLLRIEKCF